MATIKSYTDLEQSKKLVKILPFETADMYYPWYIEEDGDTIKSGHRISIPSVGNFIHKVNKMILPCWSLTALLDVLPQSITKYIENERCQKTFHLNLFRSHYYCCSYCFSPSISDDDGNNTLYCVGKDNWVDACVAMIEKLHELKML